MAVGGFSERLAFLLTLDPSNAIAGMKRVGDAADKELGKTDDRIAKLGGRMQTAGVGMLAGAGVAIGGLVKLAQASEEARQESIKLDQALSSNATFAAAGRKPFEDLAQQLQHLTGVDGDAVVGMEGFLGTLGRSADETLRLTPLVVDLAQRFGLGLEPAARLVNNAIEGSTGRLERLIGKMHEGESVTDALSRTVGGFAENQGKTFSGQLDILKQNLGDVAEGIGGGVVGALNNLLGPIQSATEWFNNLDEGTQSTIGSLATYASVAVGAAGAASFVIGSLIKMKQNFSDAREAISSFLDARGGLAGISGAATGAGVAIGILTALIVKQANDQAAAKARADEYTQAIQAQTGAINENVDAVTAKRFADSNAIQAAADAGADLAVFATSVRDGSNELRGLNDALLDVQGGFLNATTTTDQMRDVLDRAGLSGTELGVQLLSLAETGGYTGQQFLDLVNQLGGLEADFQGGKDAADRQARSLDAVSTAAGGAADGEGDLGDETSDTTDKIKQQTAALDEQRKKLQEQADAIQASLGNQLSLADANIRSRQALAEYQATMADSSKTALEREQAGNDLLQAYLAEGQAAQRAAEDQAKASGDAANAQALGAQAQIRELEGLASTLAEDSPLRSQLAAYIDQLRSIPKTQTTTIETVYAAPSGSVPTTGSGLATQRPVQRRAGGGPVTAGQPYLVGDRNGLQNAELFVPGASGAIYPINMMTGAGGRGVVAGTPVGLAAVAGVDPDQQADKLDHIVDVYRRIAEAAGKAKADEALWSSASVEAFEAAADTAEDAGEKLRNAYDDGAVSADEYLAALNEQLTGVEQYSDKYERIVDEIDRVNEKRVKDQMDADRRLHDQGRLSDEEFTRRLYGWIDATADGTQARIDALSALGDELRRQAQIVDDQLRPYRTYRENEVRDLTSLREQARREAAETGGDIDEITARLMAERQQALAQQAADEQWARQHAGGLDTTQPVPTVAPYVDPAAAAAAVDQWARLGETLAASVPTPADYQAAVERGMASGAQTIARAIVQQTRAA